MDAQRLVAQEMPERTRHRRLWTETGILGLGAGGRLLDSPDEHDPRLKALPMREQSVATSGKRTAFTQLRLDLIDRCTRYSNWGSRGTNTQQNTFEKLAQTLAVRQQDTLIVR